MRGRTICLLLLFGLVPALLFCQTRTGTTGQAIAFTNATVIDVVSGAAQPGMTVVVRGERIAEVGSTREIRVPDGVRVIDASGKYLIPGLWDMHVHPSRESDADIDYMPLLIGHGITGVRDMAGDFGRVEAWRRQIADGTIVGPRIVAPGRRLDGPGPLDKKSIRVGTDAEARAAVRAQKALGVDFIKVYSMIPREAFFALADESNKLGIDFAGHVPFRVKAAEASDAGIKSIEHMVGVLVACSPREAELMAAVQKAYDSGDTMAFYAADILSQGDAVDSYDPARATALFKRFAANRTYHALSLVGWKILRDFNPAQAPQFERMQYVTPTRRSRWNAEMKGYLGILPPRFLAAREKIFAKQLEVVRSMHVAGVPFIAGTDTSAAYAVPGVSLHEELALMVEAGLSPFAALRSATYNPVEYLGLLDSLGTIEAGKLADLVLLDANPLQEIGNTRRISAVVANGRLLVLPELDAMLRKVREEVNRS